MLNKRKALTMLQTHDFYIARNALLTDLERRISDPAVVGNCLTLIGYLSGAVMGSLDLSAIDSQAHAIFLDGMLQNCESDDDIWEYIGMLTVTGSQLKTLMRIFMEERGKDGAHTKAKFMGCPPNTPLFEILQRFEALASATTIELDTDKKRSDLNLLKWMRSNYAAESKIWDFVVLNNMHSNMSSSANEPARTSANSLSKKQLEEWYFQLLAETNGDVEPECSTGLCSLLFTDLNSGAASPANIAGPFVFHKKESAINYLFDSITGVIANRALGLTDLPKELTGKLTLAQKTKAIDLEFAAANKKLTGCFYQIKEFDPKPLDVDV